MNSAPGAAVPNADVRWIASYPNSGNAWVRFLVYQYFHGRAASTGPIFAKTYWPLGPMLHLRERSRWAVYAARHPGDTILSWISYINRMARSAAEIPSELQRVRNFIAAGGAPN